MHLSRNLKYIALILVLAVAGTVRAAIIAADAPPPPAFTLTMHSNTAGTYNVPIGSITPIQVGDGWQYQIDGSYTKAGYDVTYSFTIDPDPSIVGSFNVTNHTTITGDYTMTFTLPVSPGFNPSQLSGSVGVTVTNDSNGSATAASVAPDSIYRALIDGVTVKTLMNDPTSVTATFANDSNTATDRFGIPVPVGGGAVNSSIGMVFHASLTAGDAMGITGNFTANPVPEPAALLSLVLGGIVLARRRK